MSTVSQTAVESKTQKAIAVSIGANYIDTKVFDWIDGAVKLNAEQSKCINDPPSGELLTEHLVNIAVKENERNKGKELSQIPVYVTNAAEIKADGGVTLPFFKNIKLDPKTRESFSKELYYPEKSINKRLAEAGLPTNTFKLNFGNDTLVNMQYAAKKFKLLDGEVFYHMIAGKGSNIASATVGAGYEVSPKNIICSEPGHQLMPGIEENLALEGKERKALKDPVTGVLGAAESYIAGCNEDNPQIGPKATATNLMNLMMSKKDEKEFEAALKILNTKSGKNLSKADLQASKVFEAHKAGPLKTRLLGELAKAGDTTAQAILIFTATRMAEALAELIKKDIKENKLAKDSKISLLTMSGGLSENLHQNCPEAIAVLKSSLKSNLGELQNRLADNFKIGSVETKEGFDGTIELAEYALSQGKAHEHHAGCKHDHGHSPVKKAEGFFTNIWNWIKSFFCAC